MDLDEEEVGGGHTKRDHVGKSVADLVAAVEKQTQQWGPFVIGKLEESSFLSKESANDFINRSLEQNRAQVDAVATGVSSKEAIETRFGYITGKQAFRPTATDGPYIRDTYEVTVVLQHDYRAPNGYRVLTAYPSNKSGK